MQTYKWKCDGCGKEEEKPVEDTKMPHFWFPVRYGIGRGDNVHGTKHVCGLNCLAAALIKIGAESEEYEKKTYRGRHLADGAEE